TRVLTHLAPRTGGVEDWQGRLRNIMNFPRRTHVHRFMQDVVLPAYEEVAEALRKEGAEVEVSQEEDGVRMAVMHGAEEDFVYAVHPRAYDQPAFVMRDTLRASQTENENRKYFRA